MRSPTLFLLLAVAGCSPAKAPVACIASAKAYEASREPDLVAREKEFTRTHPSAIAPDEAIEIAEQFVRAEGFTTEPPTRGPNEIHHDIMEGGSFDDTMAFRFDSLVPHPVGVRRRPNTWAVAFPFSQRARERSSRDDQHGRVVHVSIDGRRVWIQHQDVSCLAMYVDD